VLASAETTRVEVAKPEELRITLVGLSDAAGPFETGGETREDSCMVSAKLPGPRRKIVETLEEQVNTWRKVGEGSTAKADPTCTVTATE